MLRKVAIALALVTAMNTIPIYADTNSPWVYPNATLKGDNMDTLPCIIRTSQGDKVIDAVFYEGKSYIPLNAFRELALNNHKVTSVMYEAPTKEEAKFKIEITYSGEGSPSLSITGKPDTVFRDIDEGYWMLTAEYFKNGESIEFAMPELDQRVINRNGYLYVPLSFIRDQCSINVIWQDNTGERSIRIPGSNNIQEKINEASGTYETPIIPEEGTWNMSLTWGENEFKISSVDTNEKVFEVYTNFMDKVKNNELGITEEDLADAIDNLTYSFPDMSIKESALFAMDNVFYILYYPLFKVESSITVDNVKDVIHDNVNMIDFLYIAQIISVLGEDTDFDIFYDSFVNPKETDKEFEAFAPSDNVKELTTQAVDYAKSQNISDHKEFVLTVAYKFLELGGHKSKDILGITDTSVDAPHITPTEIPEGSLKYTLNDYTFISNENTTIEEYKEAFDKISFILSSSSDIDFGIEELNSSESDIKEVSDIFKIGAKVIIDRYKNRVQSSSQENIQSIWEDFYYDISTYQITAIHAASLHIMSKEEITSYYSMISDANKAIQNFDTIDSSIVSGASKVANNIYKVTKDEQKACISFDMYLLSNMQEANHVG